jgi:hypothetical protein
MSSPTRRVRAVRLLGALFVATVASACAHAQTADSIIALNVAARGGLPTLHAIRTERLAGSYSLGTGGSAVDTVEIARPGRIRTTLHLSHGMLIQAADGDTAWMVSTIAWRGDSSRHVLPPEQAKNIQAGADIDGPLVDYAAKGNQVTFAGVDTADGRSAYVLHVTTAAGLHDTYYIDRATHLQTKWRRERKVSNTTVTFETFFRDYRPVGGTMIAFRIDSDDGHGGPASHHVLESAEVNVPIDAARFRVVR